MPTAKETGFVPEMYLSSYVHEQLSALHHCDTITVDPHKSGFCPYPGGAICYRDRRMNSFLSITAKVLYYHGKMILGDVGIEGSKPGAAAVGVMMANRVIIHNCFSDTWFKAKKKSTVQTSRLFYLNTSRGLVEYSSKQISFCLFVFLSFGFIFSLSLGPENCWGELFQNFFFEDLISSSLRRRRHLTSVRNVCEAAPGDPCFGSPTTGGPSSLCEFKMAVNIKDFMGIQVKDSNR